MKYCFQCGRITSGQPLFCNFCGRTFDVKLCPRLHVNPRIATVCSACGSRELSEPQPKISMWLHLLGFFVRIFLGVLLVWGALSLIVLSIEELLQSSVVQEGLVLLGILFIGLWVLWAMLPQWIRKVIRHLLAKKEHKHDR